MSWWRKSEPETEPVSADAALSSELMELRKQLEAYTQATSRDLAALSARVEKLEFLLHQRDNVGQGPAAVTRLPFREFKRLTEAGLNPKGA